MITYDIRPKPEKLDCLIVPIWKGKTLESSVKQIDKDCEGVIQTVLDNKDFEGAKMQKTVLYTPNKEMPRLLLVGLGETKKINVRILKQAIGSSVLSAQARKWGKLGIVMPRIADKKFGHKGLAAEIVIAVETANYSFDEHKTKKSQVKPIESVHLIVEADKRAQAQWQKGIEDGQKIAAGVTFTRMLGNTPPSVMTPALLAKHAEDLSKELKSIKTKVLSLPEIKKLGMGCLLGVSQGSELEPKFIIMEYKNGPKQQKPTVLVGKGITFDSGGLSLKPSAYMTDMKFDMLGAATVLGTMKAAAALGLKKNIIGLVPSCENMPSGSSYRPDDILINMDGKSVLIENTDAEGRLILCDALSYAKKYEPREVIDFATLTGACLVAIGNQRSGLFTDEDKIAQKMLRCAELSGEQLWRLPLGPEFSESLKCEIADIKNTGQVGGRGYGGASTAAAFLQYFTDYPWAHVDLSSSYFGGKGMPYIRSGANGFGVQTMVEYLRG
jgi:leucyl aminopeptidase